jgi:hypothetical protein
MHVSSFLFLIILSGLFAVTALFNCCCCHRRFVLFGFVLFYVSDELFAEAQILYTLNLIRVI